MLAKLETLPWLVLSRICKYLDEDDGDTYAANQRRSDLWAFSLTSRQCCTVAAGQRFCQVRVAVANPDDLMRVLEQWAEMLDRDGGRYRYVRRLKVIPPYQDNSLDKVDNWDEHSYAPSLSDMPRFCRPSIRSTEQCGAPKLESTMGKHWLALARFIGRLPALKDVAWGFRTMPQPVLAAIHALGACRLHMHCLRLDSLVLHRSGYPQVIDIDPDDYALAMSPALYSVVAEVRDYETDGQLNYIEDAVLGMAAGAAPNLQHVWLTTIPAGDSISLREAVALGKPPAPPNHLFSPKVQARSLRSLFFTTKAPRDINAWAARTDFSKLCRLALPWNPVCLDILADIATYSKLALLRGLCLNGIKIDSSYAVHRLLTALNSNSLQSLHLDGYIDDTLFNTILDQYGKSLRYLSLQPYPDYNNEDNDDDDNLLPPPIVLTPALSARLADKCPNLEHVQLPVNRTLGDARECAVYCGLGRLPRLRRLSLTLRFTVHPNEDMLDEDAEFSLTPEEIPRAHLSQAFANAAVDAGLARAVFDLISSPSGGLQRLQLLTERTTTSRYSSGFYDVRFRDLLRWFARSWICERRNSGNNNDTPVMEIQELRSCDTVEAGKEWQYLAEASRHYNGEEVYSEAFGDVWPQTTLRWWEDWRSIPLCPDDSRAESK